MGRATVAGRYALFAGSNGNGNAIEYYDAANGVWGFAKHNLSLGREQVRLLLSILKL
jgi:hypothetical protein